ncbi:MAG: 6-carboxytetrahydropterin synthase QueD [Huintestinicola sp.]
MYVLKTEAAFDSAHFLSGYEGKCSNIHGHRWKIEAEVFSEKLISQGQTRGMVIDFGDLKSILKAIADSFDHAFIYEKDSLRSATVTALNEEGFRLIEVDFRPTAENFAAHICKLLEEKGLNVRSVTVYETPANCAVYYPERQG